MKDIPLFKIYWDQEDIRMTNKAIERGSYWATGPNIGTFETMISEYIGTKYCVVFNSGTSALFAILLAYDIGPGDEVIVPSFTFIATANAPLFVGAKHLFADIEEVTYGLDPKNVKSKITSKTKAIMPIHYTGCPCMARELKEIADDHNLILIEDAAQAFGSAINGKKVGTFGHSAVLSFCQSKIITTGEGGAIITDSRETYEKLKLIRSHSRVETNGYFNSSDYVEYMNLGYNFRLSDISAALGIAQLKKVDKLLQMRQRNGEYMTQRLSAIEEIIPPRIPRGYSCVYQMYTIRVRSDGDRNLRDDLMTYLSSKGIMTNVNYKPVHLSRFYRERFGHTEGELPVTEKVSNQVLTLPMYPTLTEEEINYIGKQIEVFFANGGK